MAKEVGRPSKYSKEIADQICLKIALSSNGIHAICKGDGMPCPSTVFKWLNEHKEFSDNYARAREQQADLLADEIIEIADDSSGDEVEIEIADGVKITKQDHEFAARSRLRVDARKWKASKLAPKKYGDKIEQTISGDLKLDVSQTQFSIKPKGK
jgi:hypothetical protein